MITETASTISGDAGARRPLRVRNLSGWRRTAVFMVGRGITPNAISIVGLVAGVAGGAVLAATSLDGANGRLLLLAGLVLMVARAFCNILDGVMAIELGAATRVGALFNEVPDRVSDAAVLVGAGYAVGGVPELGWAAALGAVFAAYVRVQGQVAGAPADYGGLFGKPGRMIVLSACMLVLLLVPGSVGFEVGFGSDLRMGIMGIGTAAVAVGTVATSWFRLRRTARELSRPYSNSASTQKN